MIARKKAPHAIKPLAAMLMAAACFGVMAAGSWLSGPSVISAGEPAVFNGGNFVPNAAVTVIVTEPSGRKHSQVIGVNDDGTLSYQVPISAAGTYEVQVANQTGEVLSTAAVVVSQ